MRAIRSWTGVKETRRRIRKADDNGFPYDADQWISAAGTNWATMALIAAARSALADDAKISRPDQTQPPTHRCYHLLSSVLRE